MKVHHGFVHLVAGLVMWAAGSANAQDARTVAREWRVSERLTVSEIRPGAWIHTSWRQLDNGVKVPANGLLVRDGDGLILVDTAWGAEITEELFGWIDSELELPVTLAIVTHFHGDSMGGTPILVARGIPIAGHPLTRELGAAEGVPLPEAIGDLRPGDAVSAANVEVFYPGPGHSKDNLVVYVPHLRLLFGTCAVRHPDFPGTGNTADADLESWPVAIGRVQRHYPQLEIVVPGHGPPGDASLLAHTVGLFSGPEG